MYTHVRYWNTRALALKFLSEKKKEKRFVCIWRHFLIQ